MFAKISLFEYLSKKCSINSIKKCTLFTKISKLFKKKNDILVICNVCCELFASKNIIQCHSGHSICKNCVQQMARNYTYSLSYETIIKGYPCPHYRCREYLRYEICSKFLSKKIQNQIQSKINEALLMKARIQYEKCPKCGFLAEIFDEKIFNCPCCSYKYCYNCKKRCWCSHNYEKCVKTMKQRNDELSEALIHRCYRCNVPFIKIDGAYEGCNQMDCKCGASQCYACREPLHGYIGGHHCSGKFFKAEEIHERDIENAKVVSFLKKIF